MGCCYCCSSKLKGEDEDIDKSYEIKINKYTSKYDEEYNLIEKKQNFISYITSRDFAYSLNLFSMDNATLNDDYSKKKEEYTKEDSLFKDSITQDYFQSFIENKIFKHPITADLLSNEEGTNICKETYIQIFSSLEKKLLQADKQNKKKTNDSNRIKKYHILCFAILYGSGLNISKIKLIFDLFKDENNKLKKSEYFEDFLLSLFLIPAYCILYARIKLGTLYNVIGELPDDKVKEILQNSELKDSMNLTSITLKKIFPDENKELSYDEWKNLFSQHIIDYILSSQGVRFYLEKYNV